MKQLSRCRWLHILSYIFLFITQATMKFDFIKQSDVVTLLIS